jgi:hypothetical protein
MFDADTEDKSDEPSFSDAKLLLRTRRQSRGAIDGNIVLSVPGADQQNKMQQITQKIAQKVKVDNLVRNLKTTELEKFSLNKQHWVYIQKVVDDTKREINSSVQLQLYKEVLEILKNTMKNYRTNLGKDHASKTIIIRAMTHSL